MRLDVVRVFRAAQWGVTHLPEPLVRAVFTAAADGAWLAHGAGVRQLESNLARLRPDLDGRALRRVSRQNLRGYLRYYRETFQLGTATVDQLGARVRAVGDTPLRAEFAQGRAVVIALGHTGNWDLAGAWAEKHLAHLVTVVEHLQPEELFQGFLDVRTGLGMTIIPVEKGTSVFRQLIRHTRGGASIVPLLADRDLSSTGVDVSITGQPARVARGPAALSLVTGRALHGAMIRHERLTGARRRAAGTPWGTVIEFSERIDSGTKEESVAELSTRWVDWVAGQLRRHPEQWHMMQKVFVADLDQERLARAREAAGESAAPSGGSGESAAPSGGER
ncbi:MAG: phosphatidylinositol mannoside acyltransferase [Georgenia sp.]